MVDKGSSEVVDKGGSWVVKASLLAFYLGFFFDFGQIITLDFFDFWQIICLDNFFFISLHPENQVAICITKEL